MHNQNNTTMLTTDIIPQKVEAFFKTYPRCTFAKRQLLVRAEEPVTRVFYIVEGRVNQYDITATGNEVVVNVFKPGAFFPMSSALNKTPNNYFFEASTVVVAHSVPFADAVQFLKDNPDVTLDLLARVYRGVDGVLRRMAHLMGGNSESRLRFEILNATYRFGEAQADGSLIVPLKESDIAKQSGLARETVSRNMQAMKAAAVLDITSRGIIVKDIRRLEKYADGL
jgi:CRP/FNR family transcriptional regulator, cyclic AMP receptor protein